MRDVEIEICGQSAKTTSVSHEQRNEARRIRACFKDLVDLAGLPAFDAAAEGERRLGDRNGLEAAEERPVAPHQFHKDRRADDIDAQAARQLDRRGAGKSLQRAIDHAGRRARDDGLSARMPAIRVIEPPSRSTSRAASVRLTCPINLLARPRP